MKNEVGTGRLLLFFSIVVVSDLQNNWKLGSNFDLL